MRPAALVARHAARDADAPLLISGSETLTYGQAAEWSGTLTSLLGGESGHALGVQGSAKTQLLGLIAGDAVNARVYLLPDDVDDTLLSKLGLTARVTDSEARTTAQSPGHEPGVVVFTSGTTGVPKAALHSWDNISARVRVRSDLSGIPWLLPYNLRAYAGLQVLLHALGNGGTAIVSAGTPAQAAELAARHGVTHLTGTPTFFRFLLSTAPAAAMDALDIAQITLGGEAVDQPLLDRLAARFPSARVGHIYASTELGACFSVHDGRAGFPAAWLDDETRPVPLTVREGELWVRSPRGMRGYLSGSDTASQDGWFPTGDRIDVQGDRALFLGRASERINVGGAKVYPFQVEQVLMQVDGVQAVRVSGISSSLAGQLVQAEVVAAPDTDVRALRKDLLAHARDQLEPHMVPRRVVFVDALSQNAAGKVVRRTE